ncbi:protection of telomeres protein 1b isoform X2 [Capsella rubella]|uniref:protection of telomeres protein 1b isoform X2 n=1 Tax=Capsella rubella TaxID=81985 RepID=UPI000CD50CA5|nr:protection of telomeres protein 1b isoform X2 [Capsella rubella]
MEIRDDYKFLRIQDAFKALHLHVNLIGVIVELDFSTGSDFSCSLKIVDPWHSGSALPVKFVARTIRSLPRVESIGDIILLSRVKIVLINRKITALCNETSSSTFSLFNGEHGVDFIPYQSSPKFLMREQDKSFLSTLREWMVSYKFEDGSCSFTSLKDIKEGECSNLSCQIVHISKVYKDRWYIYVWDGTELPPCNILVKSERPPLCVEPEMLPTYMLRKFPTFGSVLRIIVDRVSEKQAIHCLQPGQHVKFLNIFFQVNMGLWNATFTPSTKMQYTMSRERQPFSPQRMWGEKLSSRWNPIARSISRSHSGVAHEDAPFVSLMDILTHHNVTAKFRCVVRFIQVYPPDVRKLRDSNGKFKLLAVLEDATARIHASVYADEGEKFFGCEDSNEEAIGKKLNRLLGGEEVEQVPRNPPWVQCCLFSFYKHKMDQWGSRRYRIFDTWINSS